MRARSPPFSTPARSPMPGESAGSPAWSARRRSPAAWSPRRTRETARNRRHRPTPCHEAAVATARLEVLFRRRGTLNRMEDHLGITTTDRGPYWTSSRKSFSSTGDSARLHTRSGSSSIGLRSDTAPHAKRCQLVFRGHGSRNETAGSIRSRRPPTLTNLTGFVREAIQNVNPQRRTFLPPCVPGVISPGMPR